ncbi:hypothetical protein QN277_023451 [Acacia crassicarpa]|uniref:Uncharacterized protein n=1 Tax=Acacia crassicarpa TaxID=499986 RepID=A0AAE1MQP8_9FABA|nr:hypothetical protein QN277_023451 [Acacia crassicarpa]
MVGHGYILSQQRSLLLFALFGKSFLLFKRNLTIYVTVGKLLLRVISKCGLKAGRENINGCPNMMMT